MNIKSKEFEDRLQALCKLNWKAGAILNANDNDFSKLPEHQQKMFLKVMGIESVETTIKSGDNDE